MLFSIITVCFNSEKTIRRTIESVLNQSYKDFEYIIVDGKSTDKTMNIIKEYEDRFNNRLKYSSEPDSGIYNAMNKGIRLCKGSIIGIVNSDDWLQPDALEIVKKQADELNETDFIISGWLNFHYNDGTVNILTNSNERFKHITKLYGMGLRHPATFVSATVYQQVGVFDENLQIAADRELIIRCYKNKNIKFCLIPYVLSNMSDGGVSEQRPSYRQIQKRIEESKYILHKYVTNKYRYFLILHIYKFILFSKWIVPLSLKKIIHKR